MYLTDLHTHSLYSFDSESEPAAMFARAVSVGLSEIAVTDHYDICNDAFLSPLALPCNTDAAFAALSAARESFDGKLKIKVGIELGEGGHNPGKADEVINHYGYDIVIGSLHNLLGMPDFFYIDYSKMTHDAVGSLFERYLYELCEMIDWGNFDTLAHLTYPFRYFCACGHDISLDRYMTKIKEVLSLIIKKGIALEVNTSGYRKALNGPLPPYDIVKQYIEMGGELITLGSDAHIPEDIGCDIENTLLALKAAGVKYICTYTLRKPEMIRI